MKIDDSLCIGCGSCLAYCPMGAIRLGEVAEVDLDECVECGVCYRSGVCPVDAFVVEDLAWPRSVRGLFSDPTTEFKETGVYGRGTEEMKTNDVTDRLTADSIGIAVELGRPAVGARFSDVEIVSTLLASLGAKFEPKNPVTQLMDDTSTGKIRPAILNEKVISAIVECVFPADRLQSVLASLNEAADQVDTVFSVDCTGRVSPDGTFALGNRLTQLGIPFFPNGKTNVGLGRVLPTKE